jgi:predicted PolB exonuclease-like 3'-5' exonuclease
VQTFILDLETAPIADAADYLEPVAAPDNYKKPEAIAAYQAEAAAKQLERAALDVDLAQIICLGLQTPDGNTQIHHAGNVSEVQMLTWLWEAWGAAPWEERQFVTFNGLRFDIPMLLRRSLYLGVKAPVIQMDRFKHPQVVDVMALLAVNDKSHSMQFYLNRLKYPHGGPDITGKDVGDCYKAGDWTAIAEHCRQDVEATAWLARRVGAIK